MEWRKVKNIIILVLLLVNGFLLVLVGARQGEVRRYEQSAVDQAIQVLAQNGIQTSQSALTAADGLFSQSLDRNVTAEGELASALLGETAVGQNQGGGLYSYQGSRGQVSFRAGGELSADLEDHSRWETSNPVTHAGQLLDEMGVDAYLLGDTLAEGDGQVMFCQMWEGVALFSCQVVFAYEDSRLVRISGNLLTGEIVAVDNKACLDLPTALIRFLDEILASGDVCSAVESMEPGYRLTQSFSSTVYLNPVWLISTNTTDYYMDASTGELTRAAGE